jgi:hypothetical protein
MSDLRATAYVSMGVWVAGCPRPWCIHADHCGPGPQTGRVGGLTLDLWHCFRCGLVCPADWPAAAADINALLAARPQPETRNWLPGETVEDLLAENAIHGLLPADGPSRVLTSGGHLTQAGRELVTAGGALAIGA